MNKRKIDFSLRNKDGSAIPPRRLLILFLFSLLFISVFAIIMFFIISKGQKTTDRDPRLSLPRGKDLERADIVEQILFRGRSPAGQPLTVLAVRSSAPDHDSLDHDRFPG